MQTQTMAFLRCCGPKLSVCCTVLSAWGIVMLFLLGIFLYTNSLAFIEDLPLSGYAESVDKYKMEYEGAYRSVAINCWIGACLYLVTLAVSIQQYYVNRRDSMVM